VAGATAATSSTQCCGNTWEADRSFSPGLPESFRNGSEITSRLRVASFGCLNVLSSFDTLDVIIVSDAKPPTPEPESIQNIRNQSKTSGINPKHPKKSGINPVSAGINPVLTGINLVSSGIISKHPESIRNQSRFVRNHFETSGINPESISFRPESSPFASERLYRRFDLGLNGTLPVGMSRFRPLKVTLVFTREVISYPFLREAE